MTTHSLIKKFHNLYFPHEESIKISKDEIEKALDMLKSRSIVFIDCLKYSHHNIVLNGSPFKSYSSLPWNNTASVDTKRVIEYKFPPFLEEFYSMFDGVEFDNLKILDLSSIKISMQPLFALTVLETGCEELHGEPLYIRDWFTIAVAKGGFGELYTNLNPSSEFFGKVFSYALDREGWWRLEFESFDEYISELIEETQN